MIRREYLVNLIVNGRSIVKVIIDPHYEVKHAASICDALILELVQQLAGKTFDPDAVVGGFNYFVADNLLLRGNQYRLIWLLERDEMYIGVVNAYRRRKSSLR